ncbi:hypothetical protein FHS57_006281 [Runella defluvii]|uniref:Uncharacterized protein n=1 Tax=Runella defluvii TaxID=370973 RepID=A0A7W6ETV1_9BACT|nr:hypothetical protein [Runella defluvii]MBB3842250.1 hypothetical protein [Runella defluvii]
MEKRLNHYDIFEVIDTFDIKKNRKCEILANWVSATGTLNATELSIIEQARQRLELKWDEWNEEELKMLFISIVFFVVQVEEPEKINTFFERKFAGEVNGISISLVVDCMLASPTNSGLPKSPYFFMQEFKRSLGDSHDPEGQMLAAMILAQNLNKNNKENSLRPIYGCWIQGRVWQFTVLNGKEYCVSRSFDATDPEALLQIVFILRKLKELILAP